MEVREITRKIKKSLPPFEREELIKKKRLEDDVMVNGYFEFMDAQGGWLEFTHRVYPGESVKIIKLIHGERCDLPMGIVRHINGTKRKVRRYDLSMPMEGAKPPRSFETVSRCRFTSSDIM